MESVFLSFENHDTEIAHRLCKYLEEHGRKCWIAPRDIAAGVDYAAEITRAIKSCSALILICSSHTSHSEHVRNEISLAFGSGVMILPYCLHDAILGDSLEYYLATKHRIYASEDEKKDFELILDAVENQEKLLRQIPIAAGKKNSSNRSSILVTISIFLLASILIAGGFLYKKGIIKTSNLEDVIPSEVNVIEDAINVESTSANNNTVAFSDNPSIAPEIVQTVLTIVNTNPTIGEGEPETNSLKDIIDEVVSPNNPNPEELTSSIVEDIETTIDNNLEASLSAILSKAHSIDDINSSLGMHQVDINTTSETIEQSYLILSDKQGNISTILSPRNESGLRENIFTHEKIRKVEYSKDDIVMYIKP